MKQHIYQIFHDYFSINDFIEIYQDNDTLIFSNKKCELKFIEDYCDIYLEIINPINRKISYNFGIVLFVVKGIDLEFFSNTFDIDLKEIKQCNNYLRWLNEINIAKGDFSWVDQYEKFSKIQIDLHHKLFSLDIGNPIHRAIFEKFRNQDDSWQLDIENIDI
jgi:hypothetical protein